MSAEQEKITTLIRDLDVEFCKLPIPRGVHAAIQNGMSELVNKVQGILAEDAKDDST